MRKLFLSLSPRSVKKRLSTPSHTNALTTVEVIQELIDLAKDLKAAF
jgi:hypothetical protein